MITKQQAFSADTFHYGTCSKIVGPRGGVTYSCEVWRRNGQTQTWVRQPERFRVPVKHGLRHYGQITDHEASQFHVSSECPVEDLRNQR